MKVKEHCRYFSLLTAVLLVLILLGGLTTGIEGVKIMIDLFQACVITMLFVHIYVSYPVFKNEESEELMGCNSYLDILSMLYTTNDTFHDYVDNWCRITNRGRASAFQIKDVQKKARECLEAEEKRMSK